LPPISRFCTLVKPAFSAVANAARPTFGLFRCGLVFRGGISFTPGWHSASNSLERRLLKMPAEWSSGAVSCA
jgi:hypothetical protein